MGRDSGVRSRVTWSNPGESCALLRDTLSEARMHPTGRGGPALRLGVTLLEAK